MNDEFGEGYASSLARDHVLGALGNRTAVQALDAGVPAREVWDALCEDMDVPAAHRLGRDTRVARGGIGAPGDRGPGAGRP